jgi:archaellum component FlaG (FlaF/FlaG flagellin family)
MASEAASSMILFIGALAAAAAVAGALTVAVGHYTTGLRERTAHLEDELATRIAIINDPVDVPGTPLTLYVKNTGSTDLDLADFVVLYDGTQYGTWTVTVGGAAATTLHPAETATITVTGLNVAAGNHRATVIAGSGYSDSLEFDQ